MDDGFDNNLRFIFLSKFLEYCEVKIKKSFLNVINNIDSDLVG